MRRGLAIATAMWAAGCLIGADPRQFGADVGEECEEDFDCRSELTCHLDGFDEDNDSVYTCREACDDDEDCDDGEVCDISACIFEWEDS